MKVTKKMTKRWKSGLSGADQRALGRRDDADLPAALMGRRGEHARAEALTPDPRREITATASNARKRKAVIISGPRKVQP